MTNITKNPTLRLLTALSLITIAVTYTAMCVTNRVYIGNDNYDAGSVKRGDAIVFNIRLFNLFPRPVKVFVSPTCGCTVATVASGVIRPFHSLLIPATVRVQGGETRAQARSIRFYLNYGDSYWIQNATVRFRPHQ